MPEKNSVKILVLTQDTWRTMKKGLFRLENIFRAQLPAATRKGTEKEKGLRQGAKAQRQADSRDRASEIVHTVCDRI